MASFADHVVTGGNKTLSLVSTFYTTLPTLYISVYIIHFQLIIHLSYGFGHKVYDMSKIVVIWLSTL